MLRRLRSSALEFNTTMHPFIVIMVELKDKMFKNLENYFSAHSLHWPDEILSYTPPSFVGARFSRANLKSYPSGTNLRNEIIPKIDPDKNYLICDDYADFGNTFEMAIIRLIEQGAELNNIWCLAGIGISGVNSISSNLNNTTGSFLDKGEVDNVDKAVKFKKLHRMGMFTAIAIAIHNFPEGLATFAAAVSDPSLGIAIAVAIAIHNIPEGIAVSIPIYYATGNKKKAFIYSFLSGLSEPVGAVIGFFLFYSFFNNVTFGILFAVVAGIMVYISIDELLPAAREYGEGHLSIYGLIAGMGVMAVSLLLFL